MLKWTGVELGDPADALRMEEGPIPVPGPGQLLVRVRASALNYADLLMLRGAYQVQPDLPFTPGSELCGEIVSVGEGVGTVVGERVIGNSVLPHGGFADYAIMDAATALPAPKALSDAEAAIFSLSYQTAWFGLHRRARLKPGETVLVHAAAGGVGSAAVQLARAAGATVIGVVGDAVKAEIATRVGAHIVINRNTQDFISEVNVATDGRGADVVYDPVGGSSFVGSAKCVAFEGRILVIGFASGVIPTIRASHALVKNYSVVGLYWGNYLMRRKDLVDECHNHLSHLVEAEGMRPLVGDHLMFSDLVMGLERLGAGRTWGRLVLCPEESATAT